MFADIWAMLNRVALLCLASLLFLAEPSIAQKSGGSGSGGGQTNGASGGGQTSDASAKGGQAKTDSGSGQQYFVESDMLVYEASMRIAEQVSTDLGDGQGKKIVLYDQQSFSNLQAYIAYRELVRVIEKGYDAAIKTPPTITPHAEVGFAPADILGAIKTGADILASFRSSTELVGQRSDPQENSLFAQVAQTLLLKKYDVVIPKLVLIEPDKLQEPKKDADCDDVSYTVAATIACLYDKRAAAEKAVRGAKKDAQDKNSDADVSSPILDHTSSLFDRLIDSLSGASAKPASGTDGPKSLAAPDTPGTGGPTQSPASQNSPNLLSTIISGQQLRNNLSGNSQVLYVGFAAAGGSYRVYHNFWVELFYRTPAPAFNGGAVVSYVLFNPNNSTVANARTLRFVYKYSKFKAKKMTDADNLTLKSASNAATGKDEQKH